MLYDDNLAKIQQLQPWCQWAAKQWLDECQRQDLQFRVTEVFRTQERQDQLYKQGRTTPGYIVTWTQTSMHTQRLAADIQVINCTYEQVEVIAKQFGIARNPELIKLGDLGHFEFTKAFVQPVQIKNPLAYLRGLINRQRVTIDPILKAMLPPMIQRLAKRLGVDLTKFDL